MISIIVPVYNTKDYISRCITSVINQSYDNFELILVDDGSTDGSSTICDKWKNKDSRIKVIHQKNNGVSSARNIALANAKGDYITFLDSDDWLEPVFLEELLSIALSTNSDIVCCNHYKGNIEETVNYRYKEAMITKYEALDCYSPYYYSVVWGKLYARRVIEKLFFNTNLFYSEDTLFYTKAVFNSNNIYWCSKPLYHYYINQNGAMKSFEYKKRITDLKARLIILNLYKKYPTLYNGAICRAFSSAMTIDYSMVSKGINKYKDYYRIRRFIKDNIGKFICNKKISIKIRLFAYAYSFDIFRCFVYLIKKLGIKYSIGILR